MNKALFIAIEGMDGSGKGTIAQMLAAELSKRGIKAMQTAEPSNSIYGKKLREMLSHDPDPKARAEEYLKLFVADRKEHLRYVILPALARGETVVCDRYKHSTIAFQSAQGIPAKRIIEMHENLPVPGITIILDVSPKVALERMSTRQRKEKFEKLEFMALLRKNYLSLPKLLPKENIKIIDAEKPVEKVFQSALRLVEKEICGKRKNEREKGCGF